MAIPQGRLSTEVVEGNILPPDNRRFYAAISYEKGPIEIEDTAEGLIYQNWTVHWDYLTNDFIATPETIGNPRSILNVADIKYLTFAFDQNARISLTYSTSISSFLFWYDTALGQTTTTDLGSDVITPALFLDDKRATQNTVNDMLLWYTKANGDTFDLFMRIQRERFLNEYLMASGIEMQYIHNIGMNSALRVQIVLKDSLPRIPYS